ncbi:Lipoprotein-releasing system ATP-binding protein LolD [Chlamydiales bacterium SCGC AG-110-P3]|nr:Lipoprotein-releasing system ATP-binding protein LolD [Chlamydiales bacterium SCGC AG-110-P3]
MTTEEQILCARGLAKSYSSPKPVMVLNDISLSVRRGETVAIIGRSGEGKSTLLQILGTLETPDRGALQVAGLHASHTNRAQLRNKHIGFVFQGFNLLDHCSALENVLMPAQIARRATGKKGEARVRAMELLEEVDLTDRASFDARLLSGGEKQRVAIARAMMNDPDLLLADEPTGNLDHATSTGLQQLLIDFASRHGKSLIVVTHDQELANRCDSCYLLQEGRLHQPPKRK